MAACLAAHLAAMSAAALVAGSVGRMVYSTDASWAATMVVDSAALKVASSVGPMGDQTAVSTADRLAVHSDECSAGLMADETVATSAVSMAHR